VGPQRTRISCIAVPPKATYAAFRKESRAKFANAAKLDKEIRGSVGEGPAVSLGPHANLDNRSTTNPILFETHSIPHNDPRQTLIPGKNHVDEYSRPPI
jgi:hypothetical protein